MGSGTRQASCPWPMRDARYPAIDADGGIRGGAWVAEATTLVNISSRPTGTRLILCKEHSRPGAQSHSLMPPACESAFITDTEPGAPPGQIASLELRHRQHARVSRGPYPRTQGHRPAQPALPRVLGQAAGVEVGPRKRRAPLASLQLTGVGNPGRVESLPMASGQATVAYRGNTARHSNYVLPFRKLLPYFITVVMKTL